VPISPRTSVFGKRSDESRTAADRARAAAERAARRSGRPLPPEAFEDAVRPPDLAPHEPVQHTVEYTPFEPEARVEIAPVTPLTAVRERPPAPPRRAPAPAQPRRRPPAAPGAPRRGRGGFWGRRVFGVIALVLIAAALYAINAIFQPFHGAGKGSVLVVVPAGADAGRIGDLLAARGVIDSATFFQINATVTGRRGGLHPGRYTLAKGMSNGDAIDALSRGPRTASASQPFKVTIPEGPSRKEMAAQVDKSAVQGSYLNASGAAAVLRRVRTLGAPKGTKTAEGFLFPATYSLNSGATAKELVGEQLDAFAENFRHVSLGYAKRKHLTRYDLLIIASMIEREAQLPRERALVSAVIYNRLKQGMPLGIDATIRYYTNNWQRPIRQSELQADEPYNSRINRGLPPTPIGNPGLASLKAAAKPANKPYLFYVRKPGNSGEHAFSSTDAQFARDVKRYQAARGGG
jgi:UPF0755 protein